MEKKMSHPRVLTGSRAACMALVAALSTAGTAQAGTATGTLNVSLTVDHNCSVVSPATLGFGTVTSLGSAREATGTLSVTCSNTTPYTVGLNAGGGTGATVATRKMASGGVTVDYTLYRDSGRTLLWGNTIGTDTLAGTGTGSAQSLTVYGRVPVQTTPAPAIYNDAVTVTVTY
jgi:spore coat protein U-like protein